MQPSRISVEEVKQRMDRHEPVAFVDCRNPTAWEQSNTKLPGAIRIPADAVENNLKKIPSDRLIVTYCT